MPSKRYCTFHIGEHFFGIHAELIQEILRPYPITPVPHAPVVVRGLINLRGQIIVALDLAARLDVTSNVTFDNCMNIVVNGASGLASLLVERVGDVEELDETELQPTPQTGLSITAGLIRGAFHIKSGLLVILDLEPVLSCTPASHHKNNQRPRMENQTNSAESA